MVSYPLNALPIPQESWEDLVHNLRFDVRINSGDITRDIGCSISSAKESDDTAGELQAHINHIIDLMLLRVALMNAFFPDEKEFVDQIFEPHFIAPLIKLGIPKDQIPQAIHELSSDRLKNLFALLHHYSELSIQNPEPPEVTLCEVAGINPRRTQQGVRTRVVELFGPHNEHALMQEGITLSMLYKRSRMS